MIGIFTLYAKRVFIKVSFHQQYERAPLSHPLANLEEVVCLQVKIIILEI